MPRPLVILLHGTRFNARSWDGYADLVDADVRAVDLPGHGWPARTPSPGWSSSARWPILGATGS